MDGDTTTPTAETANPRIQMGFIVIYARDKIATGLYPSHEDAERARQALPLPSRRSSRVAKGLVMWAERA